jgi:hypothetical protein
MALIKHTIVGTNFIKNPDVNLHDLIKNLRPGTALLLQREPDNRFDKFAVKVLTPDGIHIGYVAKQSNNVRLSTAMANREGMWSGEFSYAGSGNSQIPAIVVELPE